MVKRRDSCEQATIDTASVIDKKLCSRLLINTRYVDTLTARATLHIVCIFPEQRQWTFFWHSITRRHSSAILKARCAPKESPTNGRRRNGRNVCIRLISNPSMDTATRKECRS